VRRAVIAAAVAGLAGCAATPHGAAHERWYSGGGACVDWSARSALPADWSPVIDTLCTPDGYQPFDFHPERREPPAAVVPPIPTAARIASCGDVCATPAAYPGELAELFDLATRLEPAAVAAALAAAPLPADFRAQFVARYVAARARLLAIAGQQEPRWRATYLTPALTARAIRAEQDAALAAWPARLAALREQAELAVVDDRRAAAGWIERALALRHQYVEACGPIRGDREVCLADAVGYPLTELIHLLATEADDRTLIRAEKFTLAVAQRVDPRTDEWLAATTALVAAGHDREPPRFGVAPPRVRVYGPTTGVTGPRVDGGWDELVRIERRGARARLVFRDRRREVTFTYGTGCRVTGQVDRVTDDGRVLYREECRGRGALREDRTVAPVDVPAIDAEALRPGDYVEVVADPRTHRGYVARAVAVTWPDGKRHAERAWFGDDGTVAAPRTLRGFVVGAAGARPAARAGARAPVSGARAR